MTLIPLWHQGAACRGTDPDLFFPLATTGEAALAQIERAKAVCESCRVRSLCLEFALANPKATTDGIWGAMTVEERQRERKRRGELNRTRRQGAA